MLKRSSDFRRGIKSIVDSQAAISAKSSDGERMLRRLENILAHGEKVHSLASFPSATV